MSKLKTLFGKGVLPIGAVIGIGIPTGLAVKFANQRDGLEVRNAKLEKDFASERVVWEKEKKGLVNVHSDEEFRKIESERNQFKGKADEKEKEASEYKRKFEEKDGQYKKLEEELENEKRKNTRDSKDLTIDEKKRHWVEIIRTLVSSQDSTESDYKPYMYVQTGWSYGHYYYVNFDSNDVPYWTVEYDEGKTAKELWGWIKKYETL